MKKENVKDDPIKKEKKSIIKADNESIILNTSNEVRVIPLNDILYVERRDRKIVIVTRDCEYKFYDSFDNVVNSLDERFFEPLKLLSINLEKPILFKDKIILFSDQRYISLGRDAFTRAKYAFIDYNEKRFLLD